MIRNQWKVGDYLLIDEVSGMIRYATQLARDWDGTFREVNDMDGKHPHLMLRPIIREQQVPYANSPALVTAYSNIKPTFVGTTTVLRPQSPADHLFD